MYRGRIFNFLGILFLFLFSVNAFAQGKLNSGEVEEKSYNLYTGKNWKELITYGNKAFSQGIDYYYLRMRVGIAYYERHNYMRADKQFERALKFNTGDPVAEEYLYYCYIYTNRFEEARKLSKTFAKELAHKTKTDSASAIGFVIVEGGTKISDSSKLFQNATYAQVGLGHYVANSFSLFHALTYYNEAEFRGKTSQFQYYLQATIPLKNDWELAPAFQYLNRSLTPPPLPPPPPPAKGGKPKPPPPQPTASTIGYYIGSAELRKKLGYFNVAIGGCVSNIDSSAQYMETASLMYNPFGNNNLSIGAVGYLVQSTMYGSESAISPFVSVMPLKRLTVCASYLNSTIYHLIESDGYIVNNSFDLTPSRWTFQCSVSVTKIFDIYGLYQLENKVEAIAGFKYNYQAFIIGLKFIPS
jgi:tetratricopeptide (TPR) repeat protein